MSKTMKKFFAGLLAFVLVFAMTATAAPAKEVVEAIVEKAPAAKKPAAKKAPAKKPAAKKAPAKKAAEVKEEVKSVGIGTDLPTYLL